MIKTRKIPVFTVLFTVRVIVRMFSLHSDTLYETFDFWDNAFCCITEGDPPPFGRQYSGFLDGLQYAKSRYAVHKHPVISYADINLTLKTSNFHQETKQPWHTKFNNYYCFRPLASLALFWVISTFIHLNIDFQS